MDCSAEFVILQFAADDGELWPFAVLLLDAEDRLFVRAREDLSLKLPAEDAQVIELFLAEVGTDSRQSSGSVLLASLEDRLSNVVRITDRQRIPVTSIEDTLQALAKYLV